jgi:hypothetical protein
MLNNVEKRYLNRIACPSPPNTSAVHRFTWLFFASFPDESGVGPIQYGGIQSRFLAHF